MSRLRSQLDQMLQQQAGSPQAQNPSGQQPQAHVTTAGQLPFDDVQRRLDAVANAPAGGSQPNYGQQPPQNPNMQFPPQTRPQAQPGNMADVSNIKTSLDRLMSKVQAVAAAQQAAPAAASIDPASQKAMADNVILEIRNEFAHLQGEMKSLKGQISQIGTPQMPLAELSAMANSLQSIQDNQAAQPQLMHQVVNELEMLRGMMDTIAPGGTLQNSGAETLAAIEANFAALGQRIDMMASDSKDVSGLSRAIESSHADLANRLDALQSSSADTQLPAISEHISAIRDSIQHLPQALALPDLQLQLEKIIKSVEVLSNQGENSISNNFTAIESRLDEITRGLVALSVTGPENGNEQDFERIEARISSLANTLDGFVETAANQTANVVVETPKELQASLQQIESRLETMAPVITGGLHEDNSDIRNSLQQIESRLVALDTPSAAAVPGVPDEVASSLAMIESRLNDLQQAGSSGDTSQLDGMVAQINRLSEKMDDLAATALNSAPTAAGNAQSEVQTQQYEYVLARLDTVLEHLDQSAAPATNEPVSVDLSAIEKQIAELAERLDTAPAAPPVNDNLEVLSELQKLSERLDAISHPQPVAAMGVDVGDSAQMKALETQLSDILGKLGETASRTVDLTPVQDKLAQIESTLSAQNGASGIDLSPVDERLQNIEQSIAASRDITIEIAGQAAEEAVAQATRQMASLASTGAGNGTTPAFDMTALDDLAGSIKTLQATSENNSKTNADTFEALGETLSYMVERLTNIEAQFSGGAAGIVQSQPAPQMAQGATMAAAAAPVAVMAEMASDHSAYQENSGELNYQSSDPMAQYQDQAGAADEPVEVDNSGYVPAGNQPDVPAPVYGQQQTYTDDHQEDLADTPIEPNAPSLEMHDLPEVDANTATEDPIAAGSEMVAVDQVSDPVEDYDQADPYIANEGQNGPDMAALVRQANDRLKQASSEENLHPGGTDFLAAARRAAQAAHTEAVAVEQEMKAKAKSSPKAKATSFLTSIPQLFAKRKKIVMLAAAAVLVAALAAPFAAKLMSGSSMFADTPQAAISETTPEQGSEEIMSAAEEADTGEELVMAPVQEEGESSELAADSGVEAEEQVERAEGEDNTLIMQPEATEGSTETQLTMVEEEAATSQDASKVGQEVTKAPMPDAALGSVALRQAAASGNPIAQFEIGQRFDNGRGVETNLEKAAEWYERSAAAGFAPAQYRTGIVYQRGYGVKADPTSAAVWYKLAADQGHVSAMHNLAVLHAQGVLAGQPDYKMAASWFKQAAGYGMADSQVNLGILYTQGEGVETNLEEAYKWFALAAQTGDSDASAKRDKIAGALRPEQLDKVRAELKLWRPQSVNSNVNSVTIPEEWRSAPTTSAGLSPKDQIMMAQTKLKDLGYDPGPADGLMGNKTREAIKSFQQRAGLTVDGKVSSDLLQKLN